MTHHPSQLSRGALTTGAVGGILFGVATIVLMLIISKRGDPSSLEGFLYLYGPLACVASILLAVGMFAARKALGGWQITGGIFAILAGLGALGTLLVPMLVQFNSSDDAVIVSIASSAGTALLFSLFVSIANNKPTLSGEKATAIVTSGWLYAIAGIGMGVSLKFALRENGEMFATFSLLSTLVMAAAAITHGIGLLTLGERHVSAPEAAVGIAA
jgi:hypothetical protein